MSFKGLILILVVGMIIYSYVMIKNHNPLSRDRYEAKQQEQQADFYGSAGR